MFLGPTTEFWREIRIQNVGCQSESEPRGLLSAYPHAKHPMELIFYFSDIGHTWCEHSCIFLASAASKPNFSPIAFQQLRSYKLVLVVFTKFVVNGRIVLNFFHKE